MQTGDGLLARIVLQRPIPINALVTLCEAADGYGNGVIEVTQRGSLQVRGLDEGSARNFARVVADLNVADEGGPPLITSSLLGLDPDEPFDATDFVSSLRSRLSQLESLKSLGPKVSVLIDGGGQLHLDAVAADIRLVASAHSTFQLAIAGNASNAVALGDVAVGSAPEAIQELLEQIAKLGPSARGRNLLRDHAPRSVATGDRQPRTLTQMQVPAQSQTLAQSQAPAQSHPTSHPTARPPAEPVGTHRLNRGAVAQGFALPFGHTTASALARFAKAAADSGAASVRPAPGRSLLAIGLSRAAAENLRKVAVAEGFVVDPDDARRHVVACAGKPACASAKLPTRQLAPDVARAAQMLVGTSDVVHLSGCSKGCAHPGPAALTIVGPNYVILNGRASDKPNATLPVIATAHMPRPTAESATAAANATACAADTANANATTGAATADTAPADACTAHTDTAPADTAALLTAVKNFCAELRHV